MNFLFFTGIGGLGVIPVTQVSIQGYFVKHRSLASSIGLVGNTLGKDLGSGIRDQGSGMQDQGSGIRDAGSGMQDQGLLASSIGLVLTHWVRIRFMGLGITDQLSLDSSIGLVGNILG